MKPLDHPDVPHGKIGALLINLGTPDATDHKSVRRYLGEFLSDRRVIEVSPLIWQPILRLFILRSRPRQTAHAYQQVWLTDTDESPLRKYTREQALRLRRKFQGSALIEWAMRYGEPSIRSRLKSLYEQGCEKILLFALYPQYSATTTATAHDEAFKALLGLRWQPAIRTVPPFHDDPLYIQALKSSLGSFLETLEWSPEVILLSFHGLPRSYLEKGDPYHCHCHKTARLLRESLNGDYSEERIQMSFQSRFGKEVWLQPYTDETIQSLAEGGIKKLVVMTPGFFSDCLETLEEIALQGRETFLSHGGTHYATVPCLNDGPESIALLETIIARELSGWL